MLYSILLPALFLFQGKKKVSPNAGSPVRCRNRDSFHARDDIYSTQTSYQQDGYDLQEQAHMQASQPVPILNKRSKSSLELKNSMSPASDNALDMVVDFEQGGSVPNIVSYRRKNYFIQQIFHSYYNLAE